MSAADYSQAVVDRFAAPRHAGSLPVAPGERLQGEAAALQRRAWVSFELRLRDGQVVDGRFRAWGCPHVIAACDLAVERLLDGPLAAAASLQARSLAAALGAPPGKLGRLLVIEDALCALAATQARDT